MDQAADYLDTDDPCGDENALQFDADTDFFAEMTKRGAFNRLNYTQMDFGSDHHTTQYLKNLDASNSDDSLVMELDLHDWEDRLTEFLSVHESATASFDLENYGQELVADCRKSCEKNSVALSEIFDNKGNIGEISRAFLSVLDLVNKGVVEVDVSLEKGKSADMDVLESQDANNCKMIISGGSVQADKKNHK